MIKRIVRLHFRPGTEDQFRQVFASSNSRIRAFAGCQGLSLYTDDTEPNVFYTVSLWDSAADLEAYRQSELFQSTWAQTKPLFAEKAQAWSLRLAMTVEPA